MYGGADGCHGQGGGGEPEPKESLSRLFISAISSVPMYEAIKEAIGKGIPVVISTRVYNGRVLPVYGFQGGGKTLKEAGAISGDNLPAQKARILLMLALQSHLQTC